MSFWEELGATEEAQARGLSYDVSEVHKGVITLHRLDVESAYRWQGVATRFMRRLCAMADERGAVVELEVGSGTDDTDIVEDLPLFYSKFGFTWSECPVMMRKSRSLTRP